MICIQFVDAYGTRLFL